MGYLPQYHSIFIKLTVEQNLQAILEFLPLSYDERMARINMLIGQFGLEDQRHQIASTMSGGQKRRLEIARCLATNPQIVLLDEPFHRDRPQDDQRHSGHHHPPARHRDLDPADRHRERETLTIVDRSYVICDGEVVVGGDAQTVLSNKRARTCTSAAASTPNRSWSRSRNLRTERDEAKAA